MDRIVMATMSAKNFASYVAGFLGINSILDAVLIIIDIAIVSFAIYKVIYFFKGTRAASVISASLILFVVAVLAKLMNLKLVSSVLNMVANILPVTIVVLFAPEIRKILENLGKTTILRFFKNLFAPLSDVEAEKKKIQHAVSETTSAVFEMSKQKVGALIVFQRHDQIVSCNQNFTVLDAELSERLLRQIFIPNTPLHDGATVVANYRIVSTQVIIPNVEQVVLDKEYGTRHRAAVCASKNNDCVVVVVSEETGKVSYARNGILLSGQTPETLTSLLTEDLSFLLPSEKSKGTKKKNREKDS